MPISCSPQPKAGVFRHGIVYAFAWLSLFLLTESCSTPKEEGGSIPRYEEESTAAIFSFGEKLRIPVDSLALISGNQRLIDYEGKRCLLSTNYLMNALEIYQIEGDPKMLKRILLTKDGDKGTGQILGASWISKDSIIVLSNRRNGGNKISLVNANGEYLQVIVERGLTSTYQLEAVSNRNIFIDGHSLFVPKDYIIRQGNNPKDNLKIKDDAEARFDISTGELLPTNTPFPSSVAIWGFAYYRDMDDKGNLVYSYWHDDFLHIKNISDLNQKGYTQQVLANSRYLRPFTTIPSSESGKTYAWVVQSGQYLGVYYDSYREVYYRMVRLPSEEIVNAEGGRLEPWTDLPYSIIVLDKNFQRLGEQALPAHTYSLESPAQVLILPEGLYLGMNNPTNEETPEDEMVFQLLQLKPEVLAKREE